MASKPRPCRAKIAPRLTEPFHALGLAGKDGYYGPQSQALRHGLSSGRVVAVDSGERNSRAPLAYLNIFEPTAICSLHSPGRRGSGNGFVNLALARRINQPASLAPRTRGLHTCAVVSRSTCSEQRMRGLELSRSTRPRDCRLAEQTQRGPTLSSRSRVLVSTIVVDHSIACVRHHK